MRSKEDAHDYRYFPDPDLPPLVVKQEQIERVKAAMPELPKAMAERFMTQYGLTEYDATMMTQSKAFGRYFEDATALCHQPKLVANWLMGDVARRLNDGEVDIDRMPVRPETLAELITKVVDGTLSNNAAKKVFDVLWPLNVVVQLSGTELRTETGKLTSKATISIDEIIEREGLKQINDSSALEKIIDEVIAANAKSVEEFRAGKEKAFQALVGQAMKATKGKANPQQVNELLRKKLHT
jgi:aspartyl-tRNA(Asn)/glutamyl-tRNA(Gln) amidotransferase subunit B